MIRARQARAMRSRGQGQAAREVPVPIPTSGLFVDAKAAEISGLYASVMNNLRTDGVMVETRRQVVLGAADKLALQRIPFEFGLTPRYIDLRATQAECGGVTFARNFDGYAMVAYLSSQAVIADGLSDPLKFDGAAFSTAVFSVTSGASPASFDGVIAHHDRLFFWKTNGTLEFYYGDVGAVSGPLQRFPLDRLGNITGGIKSMISLTINAGFDANDALAMLTTTGDIVVYEGLDPGDSTLWNLATRIKVAPPLSRFGVARVGGDVWMMSALGVVSLQDTLARGVLSLVNEFSRPISKDILALVTAGGGEWQLHTAADGSQIIINYYTPAVQKQFIWQTNSKAWSTGDLPARLWHNLVLDTQFTTGPGRIGTFIEDPDGAEIMVAKWHSGWFRLAGQSQIAYLRPTIIGKGPLTLTVAVLSNHDETAADVTEATQTITLLPDNPADPGGRVSLDEVIAIGADGYAFQIRVEVTATWAQIIQMTAGVV